MTEEEKEYLRRLIENEQAEGAMRECVKRYRESYMPVAMMMRGYYEAMINVGFNEYEALMLTMNVMR